MKPMTDPDYRAMCAELLAAIQLYTQLNPAASDMSAFELTEKLMAAMAATVAALAEPVAEGPMDEELLRVAAIAIEPYESSGIVPGEYEAETECAVEVYGSELIAFAREVLHRWGRPTPQPVAVSERLPGPEDCLDEGWAWFFNKRIGWRQAVLPVSPGFTHWLPANALPTPEAND